ncbi:MAG: DNA recombination/repair protein RecA, partial [Acidobacteriota bacterium]|nr:DNA recombination/repair protein RecA [Acidobacteriota bacterium]
SAFKQQEKPPAEVIATGISQVDAFTGGGLPRGAIAEIYGRRSSGRTSFMVSALAHAIGCEEVCALVDTSDVFDPQSAAQAEINFDRLLWIRCTNNLEHAFKATDLLLQAGGFGLVMLDLGDVPAQTAKRIISSWWYRFRRTLEATPTALVVIAEESSVRACAALTLELQKQDVAWSSAELQKQDVAWSSAAPEASGLGVELRRHNSSSLSYVSSPSVTGFLRQRPRVTVPYANLLQGLSFQVECRRPLFRQNDEDVLISAAR